MITSITTILLGLAALTLYYFARHSPPSAIDWRGLLARLPLPLLALAASYGVYSFARLFVPDAVAVIQAAAFELTYIGLAVTQSLDTAQRKRATLISVGAVVASIVYNTLAGWFHRQPQLLDTSNAYADVTWLMFAILHGAPLAWVAYLVADLLLHNVPKLPSRRTAQLRALIRRLARGWRTARAAATELSGQMSDLRAQLAQGSRESAQNEAAIVQLRHELAQREQELAQLRAEAAQGVVIDGIDILAVARRLRSAGVPSRETADLFGWKESTLRSRLDKAATNGHTPKA